MDWQWLLYGIAFYADVALPVSVPLRHALASLLAVQTFTEEKSLKGMYFSEGVGRLQSLPSWFTVPESLEYFMTITHLEIHRGEVKTRVWEGTTSSAWMRHRSTFYLLVSNVSAALICFLVILPFPFCFKSSVPLRKCILRKIQYFCFVSLMSYVTLFPAWFCSHSIPALLFSSLL